MVEITSYHFWGGLLRVVFKKLSVKERPCKAEGKRGHLKINNFIYGFTNFIITAVY